MTIQECYERMGGDYADVASRLMTPERVAKFATRFINDPSYSGLCDSVKQGNPEEMFRLAHTLKGVAQNLGFVALYTPASELTELLRPGKPPVDAAVVESYMKQIGENYEKTIEAITAFQKEA